MSEPFPGVGLAYELSVAAYDMALRRLECHENRLQNTMAFMASATVAVPSIAAGQGAAFDSWWFWSAMAVFLVAIAFGIWARLHGDIIVVKPDQLFEGWLHKDEWEFKKDFVYFAGEDCKRNLDLVRLKWRSTVAVTLLFALQVALMVGWIVTGT